MNGNVFEICQTPITQTDWKLVMGENPSNFTDDEMCPVESVSYDDVLKFIDKLNAASKKYTYRLPTEEEWEFACRAWSFTDYYFGNDKLKLGDYAWYWKNSDSKTHPVKKKRPNKFGLYDMHGNVWEWTSSLYMSSGSYRVIRGGSWSGCANVLRSTFRDYINPSSRIGNVGARLVRTQR